jgi:D-hydroxyproline dehydrogenase subunit alpha
MPELVQVRVNGMVVEVASGSMVSTAVSLARGVPYRRSVRNEPRAPLCGMGICFECRVNIDGEPHLRSCLVPCEEGMEVVTGLVETGCNFLVTPPVARLARHFCDVLVVGAGPAGLAAAWAASESGSRVLVIDDNPAMGGQIWRGEEKTKSSQEARVWFDRIIKAGIEVIYGARLFDVSETNTARAETSSGIIEVEFRRLILATGARERFLPFPGWQLPNVVGAGGLQALVKSGLPIEGKRVVIAGSGPLLLAVADYLRKHGAQVVRIVEQVSRVSLARFSLALLSSPRKAIQAFRLLRGLSGIPVDYSSWIMVAEGEEKLQRVLIHNGSSTLAVDCDYLAVGFHLVPNLEIASQLGCEISGDAVVVDYLQQTSRRDVFSAGETSGIGGLELALAEGQIAGYAASGKAASAERLFAERSRAAQFARTLNSTFALRTELKQLPSDDTIVCRCEDVTWNEIREHDSWRSAKLHTRCGMGPCQGRVCGAALNFLLEWSVESVRPPVFPVRISSLTETNQ